MVSLNSPCRVELGQLSHAQRKRFDQLTRDCESDDTDDEIEDDY
jgi:hypothetical protein